MLTRRHLLHISLLGAAAGILPQKLLAGEVGDREAGVVSEVMKLTGGKPDSLTILYPEGSLDNIKPVAEQFSKLTKVSVIFKKTTLDNINTKLIITTSKGKGDFDIALPATFGIPDLAEAGALADLTNFSNRYEPHIRYKPSLYDIGDSYKGRKYGYQTDGDAYLMFYKKRCFTSEISNKKFEDNHGKKLTLPASWEELDLLLEFFHQPEKSKFGGVLFRTPQYMVWEWWIRFHAKGYFPVKEDMTPNIANDEAVQALEEMIKVTEFLHPSARVNGLFDNWKVFAKGDCTINIGWGGTQKYLNSNKSSLKGKMLFAPTPTVSYFNWGWNYVVSEFSRKQQLAYLFCLYATLPEMSKRSVQQSGGFFDPYRREHYTDPKITETYSRDFLMAHQKAMSTAIPDFYIQGQGQYMEALRNNIASAFEGDLSAGEALGYTAKQWEKITDNIGRDRQIKQWKFLKKKYPQALNLKS